MNIYVGKKVLFLTSIPSGELEEVKILGIKGNDRYYITRAKGGSDSTSSDFLFDLPKNKLSKDAFPEVPEVTK